MKLRLELHCGTKFASGFSLLELLMVIAIGVAILAISAPFAFQFYQNQLVTDTSKQLQDTLDIARSYAVANLGDAPHGVRVFPASSTYVLFQGDDYATRTVTEDQVYHFSPSVTLAATTTEVVFSQLYGTSTVDEVWSIYAGTLYRNLHIRSSGNIEVD